MAKAQYVGVNGVARKVKQPYIGVGDVARKVKNGYVGVSGVARQFFGGGIEVGQSVFAYLNGYRNEFIVVHKGLPSSAYDASCDGIWILKKHDDDTSRWDTGSLGYGGSVIQQFLDYDRFFLLDTYVQNIVKQVKIPTASGQVSTKMFLLSYTEVFGGTNSNAKTEGAVLDYFNGASAADRICYYSDTAATGDSWWLRTGHSMYSNCAWLVDASGNSNYSVKGNQSSVRFAMILPHDTQFDSNFNIIA